MRKKIKTAVKTSAFVALVWTGLAIHLVKTRRKNKENI
jgi:hypothetical protein